MTSYHFTRQGRSARTALVLLALWGGLFALYLGLEAAGWLMALIGLFTLPALWDLIKNPESGLTLTQDTLTWFSGPQSATLTHSEIDHIRLDTRLDFSVRASAVLLTGKRIHLPFESTPPHRDFETALTQAGIKVQRHHFQLFQ